MKKVILTVMLVIGVGIVQSEESFARKSLEDLRKMYELQMNAIKKTVEYQYAQTIKHEHRALTRLVEEKDANCALFRSSWQSWFGYEKDCGLARMYKAMATAKAEASREADDRLNELIVKDYPAFVRLTCVLEEKQLAIAEKQSASSLTKSGK